MLSEKVTEQLIERLVERIEEGNTYIFKKVGESVKKIGTLSPTSAQQIAQILKYGGSYNEIVKKLAEITELNVKDIYKIFEEVAKKDYQFAEQFYKYRGLDYIPYEQNIALRNQVQAMARLTANQYVNLANTLAFTKIVNGKTVYTPLFETYRNIIDTAVINVLQGKDTFDNEMYRVLKELGNSGVRTVDYASGRSVRLDTAVRMNMQGALRNLHNETQKVIGEQYGADGVEISVHGHPAPDHEFVQGRQFSLEEFDNFQNDRTAISYDGKVFLPEFEGHDRRSISEYNCQHYTFQIVLGVNKPEYTDEQLQKINEENTKGFEIDGKHYTLYEGTQLQRRLETEIRKQKDAQIIAKSSGIEELAGESQNKITVLTRKYKELSDLSGLPTEMERTRVSKYKRSAISTKAYQNQINKMKIGEFDILAYTKELNPTTKDVILTSKQKAHIYEIHPDMIKHIDKLPDIIKNPDKVYMEINGKNKNTVWLTKNIDGHNIKVTMKINTTTLYQKKELGYKNSIIQMQELYTKRINKKIAKGEIKELFDTKNRK